MEPPLLNLHDRLYGLPEGECTAGKPDALRILRATGGGDDGELGGLLEAQEQLGELLGFRELPITLKHAEVAAELHWAHRDPFDRMMVAQARVEGLTLVTVDAVVRDFSALSVTL